MKPVPRALAPELRHSPLLRPASFDETVLVPIVEEAFRRAAELPEFTAEAAERARRSPRAVRSFAEALGAPGRRFILEVKSASPSLGLIRESIDLNEYARVYGRFADGISVLTEPRFFNGSFERLAAMRRLTDRPLLAKDFIVDERQLLAARAAGADAVLLMLSVLSPEGYEKLAARAAERGTFRPAESWPRVRRGNSSMQDRPPVGSRGGAAAARQVVAVARRGAPDDRISLAPDTILARGTWHPKLRRQPWTCM